MFQALLNCICRTRFVQSALAERADLALFRQRPTRRVIWGLVVIGISYAIGWPAIAALGISAAALDAPLLLVVGGPAAYALSHLVFMLGAWLAGVQYARAFLRWATRRAVEKMLGACTAAP